MESDRETLTPAEWAALEAADADVWPTDETDEMIRDDFAELGHQRFNASPWEA